MRLLICFLRPRQAPPQGVPDVGAAPLANIFLKHFVFQLFSNDYSFSIQRIMCPSRKICQFSVLSPIGMPLSLRLLRLP